MSLEEVNYRRQKAIDTLMRMMGCTDDKGSNCEHVAAITELANACYQTVGEMIGVPMEARLQIREGVTGPREGRLG